MMSVPAINSVIPPSGSQTAKVTTGPSAGSVSPIGLTVPTNKISVVPPSQLSASPIKPSNLGVNHSPIPLSLVHENKVSGPQQAQQPPGAKSPAEKPKDLSPAKPTSNGVETPATKSPAPAQPVQASAPTTTSSPAPAPSKTEENAVKPPLTNHSEEVKTASPTEVTPPPKEEPAQNSQAPTQAQTQPQPQSQSQSQTPNASPPKTELAKPPTAPQTPVKEAPAVAAAPEAKLNNETVPSNAEPAEAEVKPAKPEAKTQANKRRREQKADEQIKDESESTEPEKKPRRIRSQVLPYQSPLPELATFINKSLKEKDANQKNNDEKLTVFYKNEFLAVRNAEGGFYLCQTLQNVYRSSHRIRIRWLSQEKEGGSSDGDIYTPDFYDFTDFECILTTVALEKLDKNKYKLPKVELERTENILKRALDVEKGVSEKPSLTEEHPDGLDLSLYKDEAQLQQKKRGAKRKSSSPAKKSPKLAKKVRKEEPTSVVTKKKAKSKSRSRTPKKSAKTEVAKSAKKTPGRSDTNRDKAVKSNADQLKVSPPNEKARVVAKLLRKIDISPVQEVSIKKTSKTKAGKKGSGSSKKNQKKSSKKPEKVSLPSTSTSTSSTRSSERRGSGVTSRKKGNSK